MELSIISLLKHFLSSKHQKQLLSLTQEEHEVNKEQESKHWENFNKFKSKIQYRIKLKILFFNFVRVTFFIECTNRITFNTTIFTPTTI